jgi:hypothetical protein
MFSACAPRRPDANAASSAVVDYVAMLFRGSRGRADIANPPWRAEALIAVAVLALGLVSLAWIYRRLLTEPPIRSDGVGYYLYLPALLIHRDASLTALAKAKFDGAIPQWTGVTPWDREHYLDKYTLGTALLESPFFAAGALVAALTGAPRDGFSPPFQYAVACAGLVYTALGVLLLGQTLRRWATSKTVALTLLAMVFGTSVFHYATFDSCYSHAFSFFLACALLAHVPAVLERRRWVDFAALGAIVGLAILVRPTNALLVAGAALYRPPGAPRGWRWAFLRRHVGGVALAVTVATAFAALQVAYWHAATGHFLLYSYRGEGFDVLHPHVLQVLFSVRKGLFFWSPVLLVAAAGCVALRRVNSGWALTVPVTLAAQAALVASWHWWWYGASFGHRAFVESVPLFALAFAALLERVRERWPRRVLTIVITAAVAWTFVLMIGYWRGSYSYDTAEWAEVARALIFRR